MRFVVFPSLVWGLGFCSLPPVNAPAQVTVRKSVIAGSERITDIAFGNGRFVIVADGDNATAPHWSVDGVHWTPASTVLHDFGRLTFHQGNFYFTQDGRVWRSSDGNHWENIHDQSAAFTVSGDPVSESVVMVVPGGVSSTTRLYDSTDGKSWTSHPIAGSENYWISDLAHGDHAYWAVVRENPPSGTAVYQFYRNEGASLDTWRPVEVPGLGSQRPRLVHGNGRAIFSGRDASAITTDIGRTVTRLPPLPGFSSNPLYATGFFFTSNALYRSTDGVNWTGPMIDQTAAGLEGLPWGFEEVAYGNGRYILVGSVREGAEFKDLMAIWKTPAPASVVTPPPHQEVVEGRSLALVLGEVASASPVSYQWLHEDQPIPGATTSTLEFPKGVGTAAAGMYRCELTNAVATVSTDVIALSVIPAENLGRLSNLSVRSQAGAGSQTLVTGFVLGGENTSGSSPLLLRGVGPTLVEFGITTPLGDPAIRLFNQTGDLLSENNDWGGSSALTDLFSSVGAFPLVGPTSTDAVLAPGGLLRGTYSIHTTGAPGQEGITLSEIYETAPALWPAPRLINLSCRSVAGSGENSLVVGFAIVGVRPMTALIRAVGPSLSQLFGLEGVLADPALTLVRQLDGETTTVATNDNWDLASRDTQRSVGAFDLVSDSKDAVMKVTLPPGLYSAILSSNGAPPGVALLEVYEIP